MTEPWQAFDEFVEQCKQPKDQCCGLAAQRCAEGRQLADAAITEGSRRSVARNRAWREEQFRLAAGDEDDD